MSIRARLMYALPMPLFFAAIGSIFAGNPFEMVVEITGFVGLLLAAFLLNEGLKAEIAFNERKIARAPSIPRKVFSAVLTGISVAFVCAFSLGQPLLSSLLFGSASAAALLVAFGLDPFRNKGTEPSTQLESDRVSRAIDRAEAVLTETIDLASKLSDRELKLRIERVCAEARGVFRAVEEDPRDLARARKFLTVYLAGLRDATEKYADISRRSTSIVSRLKYEALLSDLETSFAEHRVELLQNDRDELDIEIEVLRERLRQDGLAPN
ncbi:MAG: 5-bromo-4-chloroindolyl phosphate hydrolysis family protein [Pseudomonadota bacterium]